MGLVSFGLIQLGFGMVKIEDLVLLVEVKSRIYISVLLYSNKIELINKIIECSVY